MYQYILLFLMLVCGAGLGSLYFIGLFKTLEIAVQKKNRQTNMVLFLSFIIRATILGGSFFLLANGDWQRIVFLAIGFMIARVLMVQRAKHSLPDLEKKETI